MATGTVSKIVSRIAVSVLGVLVLASAGVVAASTGGWWPASSTATLNPSPYLDPGPTPVPPAVAASPVNPTVAPDTAAIRQKMVALGILPGIKTAYSITDITGQVIVDHDSTVGAIPASSWKIMSSLAILSALGSDHRFTTSVVASGDEIVLVGGGDPLLTTVDHPGSGRASLQSLAEQTAKAIIASGRGTVTLGYDDSLFAPPQWHPSWPPEYAYDVAPISALSADPDGDSTTDTSKQTALAFKSQLELAGISVGDVHPARAPAAAETLASVDSLPLGQIVRHVLEVSDNFGAEVLFRQVSVADGGDGSITSAQKSLTAYLTNRGLWSGSMAVSDGSGLSLGDQATAAGLAQAIRVAWDDPKLRDVLAGLPVAGVDGTLNDRFDDADETAGRGVVHAKTGTHDTVRSMTGFVQTRSGSVLVFSFILNDLTNHADATNWLDQAAAILASS
ncbi:MAG: D-alanyl-D-alanine carboxypeptidase/D-alanyl-D-alanine-endopeptidase [Propionibacteriaceae bacterium]|nr:D-alanyl-D-alanine carboxypeptidase/D-alanyl-D-alanine-endopeptidase [Propionibacteriaceae bacterium]